MHFCVLNSANAVVLDPNTPCHFDTLLTAIAPFRDGIVIGHAIARGCPRIELPLNGDR